MSESCLRYATDSAPARGGVSSLNLTLLSDEESGVIRCNLLVMLRKPETCLQERCNVHFVLRKRAKSK